MYKCTVKTYNLLNSIWQTHATVDLCVSVFSTDMHSSSLGARPSGFLCRHKINNLSSQCALHKHHNLNNLGIRQEIWQNLFDFVFKTIRKNRFSDSQKAEKSISVSKVFGKIDFHYAGEVTHPTPPARSTEAFSVLTYFMRFHTISKQYLCTLTTLNSM